MTTQIWVQIGHRAAAGDWRRGWISKESVRMAVRTDGLMQRLYACVPATEESGSDGGRCWDRTSDRCRLNRQL